MAFLKLHGRLADCQHTKPVATIYFRSVKNSVSSYTSKNSVNLETDTRDSSKTNLSSMNCNKILCVCCLAAL